MLKLITQRTPVMAVTNNILFFRSPFSGADSGVPGTILSWNLPEFSLCARQMNKTINQIIANTITGGSYCHIRNLS